MNNPINSATDSPVSQPADTLLASQEIADDLRRTLSFFVRSDALTEIRVIHQSGEATNYVFDESEADDAMEKALEADASPSVKAVYTTLNPLSLELRDAGGSAKDVHVQCRRWLLIDVDPQRSPADCSSTNEEKAGAWMVAASIKEELDKRGWPSPALADSGNGFHLLYRIEVPAQDNGLVHQVLRALAAHFNTAGVKVDTTVANPSRITKLYGTLSRKGPNTAERPHRRSRLIHASKDLEPVPIGLLQQLAASAPTKGSGSNSGSSPPGDGSSRRYYSCVDGVPREKRIERAAKYLDRLPAAISGQNGHAATYRAACVLVRDFALDPEDALRLLLERFNPRCQPPWTEAELQHKVEDADSFTGRRGEVYVELKNHYDRDGKQHPLACKKISDLLFEVTDDWPRSCNGRLFALGKDSKPCWLDRASDLFAWIHAAFGERYHSPLSWAHKLPGAVTKEEFFSFVKQVALRYGVIEAYPHCPALEGCFYLPRPQHIATDGSFLQALLNRFSPQTAWDGELINAFFLTLLWGGPGGGAALLPYHDRRP